MWRLIEYLFALAAEKYWGDVLITFKEGRILTVRATQQFQEATLPRATDQHRKVMESQDRALLALMIVETTDPRPPMHVVAQRPARKDTGWMK